MASNPTWRKKLRGGKDTQLCVFQVKLYWLQSIEINELSVCLSNLSNLSFFVFNHEIQRHVHGISKQSPIQALAKNICVVLNYYYF